MEEETINDEIRGMLEDILSDISPNETEEMKIGDFSKKIINELYSQLKNSKFIPPVIDIVQVGSTARNTNLKNDYDIDIFVRFEKCTEKETLKEIVLNVGKKVIEKFGGKCWVEYAEHPYLSAQVGKYEIDIVPCYKLNWGEKIISAVDRTPLHNEFLIHMMKKYENEENNDNNNKNNNINRKIKINNEVRLLKKFLKGIGIYGSDLKTKGFSGYLCELLIIHYGGFINTLKNAQKWRIGQKIILDEVFKLYDIENLENYKFASFKDPLIVYDPVDLNRNVAAALSKENFCKFIFYSHLFLKNPSKDFFYNYAKKVKENLNDRKKGLYITLGIKRDKDIVDDIIYPQMEKLQKSINKILMENDFEFLRYENYADDDMCYLSWEFLVHELPDVKLKIGPPVFNKKGVDDFIKKNSRYFIKDCNVCAYIDRKYKNIHELFEDLVEGNFKNKITYPKYVCPENAIIFKGMFKERY
jgi:tRNA nucleotidyltransferase (CCA-adding enzyme)